MQKIVIAGGSGLIGKALTQQLVQQGHEVVILTRNPSKYKNEKNISYAQWDVENGRVDATVFAHADAIVNLAGANVADGRWTKKRKQEIIDSRVKAGKLLCDTLSGNPHQVKVLVNASATGWYGLDPTIPNPNPFTETDPHHTDFLGTTCYAWEQSVAPVKELGIRLVILRTGIVLSNEGGALKEFLKPLRFGMAAIMGFGRQYLSWIHIDDVVRMYTTAISTVRYEGVYNAVAPAPTTNKNLMITLAKAVKGKYFSVFYVPTFILKLMLGEMSVEVLKSVTAKSRIKEAGYIFQYPTIDAAIDALAHQH